MNSPTPNQNRIMNVASSHGVSTQWCGDGTVIAFVSWVRPDAIGPFNAPEQFEGIEQVIVSTVLELKLNALGYCCANC